MVRKASFHCGRDSQRLMHATEIVVGMVDRNHVAVILEFLRERICEPREAANAHPQIQVLPFDITGRDVVVVRSAAQDARARSNASGRAVARIRTVRGSAVQLYQHRVIHVHSEGTFDGFRISAVTVRCDLNARGHTRC